ncbi:hypothetical protein Tco_0088963 [Tanacetum coccineum]
MVRYYYDMSPLLFDLTVWRITENLLVITSACVLIHHLDYYLGFDQPLQYSINQQPQSIQEDLNQQRMNDVLKAVQSLVEKLCQQQQAAYLSTHTPEPS